MGNLTSPIPSDAPLVGVSRDPATGQQRTTAYMSDDFNNWLLELTTRLNATPEAIADSVSVSASSASIAPTVAFVPTSAALFRVNVYATVVQAATVNSSLIVTIGSTDIDGNNKSQASAAMTGNTLGTVLSATFLVRTKQAAGITYETTRVSNGATIMKYDLVIVVEQLPT